MTNKKMQCYVKSVKTDADSILTKLKPAIINFLIVVGVLIGFLLAIVLINMVLEYSQPYIKALFDVIGSLFVMVFQGFFTSYNTYLVCMIVFDFIIFLFIRITMTDSDFNADERDPFLHVLNSVVVLFVLFAFNGILVIMTWDSPERFVGWSFMICETVINMIVVVAGILLYRAYLKCENKIMPANSSDWDSLSED